MDVEDAVVVVVVDDDDGVGMEKVEWSKTWVGGVVIEDEVKVMKVCECFD
jgi:hypothetical protein